MHRQLMVFPLHMCSGLPMQKVEQMIVMSLDDITMIAHAIWGGKYIRRAHSGFGAVVWVSGTECLGLLLSHQPSTLAISVPLMEQEYIQDKLFSLFIHVYAPRLFGNTLVSTTLSCLTLSWVGHYLYPLDPSIKQGMDHNLLQQIA